MNDPFESLSDEQYDLVYEREGLCVVRACPGSGKTFSVTARLAAKFHNWKHKHRGIAALSFTNVAWQQIQAQLVERFRYRAPVPHPHFLGTIDSFMNKYIFLPFGHLAMGCVNRPVLVGAPHGSWKGRTFYEQQFTNIAYEADGSPVLLSPRNVSAALWKGKRAEFLGAKKYLNKSGFATQADANYFAMKILTAYPLVARSLALRFPSMIVDEAQDTSETQMRLIEKLIEAGLGNVVLIGDPDQAIFEWNNARPDIFDEKYEEWRENSHTLTENHRSSQRICDFTHGLSSLPEASRAVLPGIKDFPYEPEIVSYETTPLPKIVEMFEQRCSECDIEVTRENVAVIYRSKASLAEIADAPLPPTSSSPWKSGDRLTQGLALAKYLFDRGLAREAFAVAERTLLCELLDLSFCTLPAKERHLREVGFANHRAWLYDVISSLGSATGAISEWVALSNRTLKDRGLSVTLAASRKVGHLTLEEVFAGGREELITSNYRLGTIHSVKGETFDAALVIIRRKGVGKYYRTLCEQNVPVSDSEELRAVYVGLTRPRRVVMLAVPTEVDKCAWEARLMAQGRSGPKKTTSN